jgi:hypothetical protein
VTKPQHDTLELCTRAGTMLKAAGFELRFVSSQSEACYFAWPGKSALIRVASHSQRGKSPLGLVGNVIDRSLTFTPEKFAKPGHMRLSDEAFVTKVALAIGCYLIRMNDPPRQSRYRGKRGTWEASPTPPASA